MHILLITSTYPTPLRPRQGAFNRVLVDALRKDHRVQVIAPVPWTQWRGGGIRAAHADTQHPIYFYPPRFARASFHSFFWWSISRCVEGISRQNCRPDIVVGYWLHPDAAVAVRCAQQLGVPSVVMSGGSDLRLLTKQPRRRAVIAEVLERADRVIVFSRDLARHAEQLGVAREKVDVIYRGVDRDCFHPRDKVVARANLGINQNAVVICWAGRLEPVKNPALLLKAARMWRRRWGNRFQALIVGEGALRKQLERLTKQLGLEESIRFEGNISQQGLAQRFAAADACVLTSLSEGTPNVLLESIACGTPFIATDVGGVADIATAGLDQLVPTGDSAALAAALFKLMDARVATDSNSPSVAGGRVKEIAARSFVPTDMVGLARAFEASFARVLGLPHSRPLLRAECAAPRTDCEAVQFRVSEIAATTSGMEANYR